MQRDTLGRLSPGVILFQDQVLQLGMDAGGFAVAEADWMCRAFGRRKAQATGDGRETTRNPPDCRPDPACRLRLRRT